jgi:DNA primase
MNVEELLVSKDIVYIPKGGDYEVHCLNPEHPDRNPSMRVDRITGIFNCFSCNFKGNLFTLFGEKVNQLQASRDLLKRKIRAKTAESIGLAFPSDCVPYTGNWRNIKPETYKKFEAFQNHETDHIGRIVFPVRDISGRIVAFNGRHTTGGTPKYLVSPHKAKMPLFPIVKPILGSVILVEGIYDMINLHDKGLDNAVCSFGTQTINEDKISMLKIQGVDKVDIFMDGDEAGQTAAKKIQTMCDSLALSHRNVYLKDTDPGALTENQVQKLRKKLYE